MAKGSGAMDSVPVLLVDLLVTRHADELVVLLDENVEVPSCPNC